MTRILDVFFSLIAAVLFLPIGVAIALVLRFTGEREVFYSQTRVGKGGQTFGLLKFATMLKNSPSMASGDVTLKDDPRILPVGKFLRKSKLNEVPQLINILLGQMSIVGPRPQTPKNTSYFPPDARFEIQSMVPGLTGIGSIVFRDEESLVARSGKSVDAVYREDIGPYKAELERWYANHSGIGTYLLLIAVTAWVVVRPNSQIYRRIWPSLPPLPAALTTGESDQNGSV